MPISSTSVRATTDEAVRFHARGAPERNDASPQFDIDADPARSNRAAELGLQVRELAEAARAQAQLHRDQPQEAGAEQNAPQQATRAGAEVNAASDQGHANAQRSAGEAQYDSAERRTAMAAELGQHGVSQSTVDVRMRAEVSQGRPAAEAPVQGQQVNVPQTKRGRGANRGAERAQQDR